MHYNADFVKNYRFPRSLDLRELCIPTNNQDLNPNCVGFAVAGYLECYDWANTGVPRQFNAETLYKLGRLYKADTPVGTRPEYCLNKALENGYIDGNVVTFTSDKDCCVDVVKFITHKTGVFVGSFTITDEWKNPSWFGSVVKKRSNPVKLGGHTVLCCGFEERGVFIQNSWGWKWGDYGFAVLSWDLVREQFDSGTYVESLQIKDCDEIRT